MKVPAHPTLIRRMLDARFKKMTPRRPVLAASMVQIAKHCSRPSCIRLSLLVYVCCCPSSGRMGDAQSSPSLPIRCNGNLAFSGEV